MWTKNQCTPTQIVNKAIYFHFVCRSQPVQPSSPSVAVSVHQRKRWIFSMALSQYSEISFKFVNNKPLWLNIRLLQCIYSYERRWTVGIGTVEHYIFTNRPFHRTLENDTEQWSHNGRAIRSMQSPLMKIYSGEQQENIQLNHDAAPIIVCSCLMLGACVRKCLGQSVSRTAWLEVSMKRYRIDAKREQSTHLCTDLNCSYVVTNSELNRAHLLSLCHIIAIYHTMCVALSRVLIQPGHNYVAICHIQYICQAASAANEARRRNCFECAATQCVSCDGG